MAHGYFRNLKHRVENRFFHREESTGELSPVSPYGVLVWYDCPQATVDICFIHGLTGDRNRTWTAHGQQRPWPATLLPPELANARVLTYGYDAYFMTEGVSSGNRLVDHARNLVSELTTNRIANGAETRPLIFVVHSLGGIIAKKAILLSQDNREEHLQGIFKCTKGIIFMGTPHRGAWMAAWAKIPVSALGVVKSMNGRLLKALGPDEELLESIQDDFGRLLRLMTISETPIEITCFFEELPLPVVGKVVSRESATIADYNALSVHANHREMVRFCSKADRGFIEVLNLLKKWQDEVGLGRSMRSVLIEMRQLLQMFEECRSYLPNSPEAELHVFSFNRTLLLLGSNKLRIEETYTQLLERACVPQIQSLMKRDAGWEDLQLQAKLRAYLKDDFIGFRKAIYRLEQNLSYFKEKLSIKDNFLAELEHDWDQETLIHEFLERWVAVQNSRDASKYERLVRKIGDGVERLAAFAPSTDGEPQEAANTDLPESIEIAKSYLHIRDHTGNLWDKLSHIWSYNCPAKQHSASIRLYPAGFATQNHEQACFGYSFLLHNHMIAGSVWRDVMVISRARVEKDPAKVRVDRKGKKKARFLDMEVTVPTHVVNVSQSNLEGDLFNICQTIEQEFQSGDQIGLLSCGDCDYIMYDEALGNRELVPLRNILPHFRNGQPIPTRQRRSISLCLASSLLLLYDTPWLPARWSLDDVFMDPNDPTRLYRKQVFTRPTKSLSTDQHTAEAEVVDNESIFCLAVALLELTFGAPLSNFQDLGPNGGTMDDRLARLITAKRLTKAIRKHEEERFASVVIKCMNPPSSSPTEYDFSFKNESFRRQFIKDVLLPLYQDVMTLQG